MLTTSRHLTTLVLFEFEILF